jgi:hypothetical protein
MRSFLPHLPGKADKRASRHGEHGACRDGPYERTGEHVEGVVDTEVGL